MRPFLGGGMIAALALAAALGAAVALPPGGLAARGAEPGTPVAGAPAPEAAGGDGGLAGLSAADVQALRGAADVLRGIALDEAEGEDLRARAVDAITRVHEALADWGRPEVKAWYLGVLATTASGRLQEALLVGGQAAGKGGAPHLGGVHTFWREVDALAAAKGLALGQEAQRVRKDFEDRAADLAKPRRMAPNVAALHLAPVKFNLAGALKPYPEPKAEEGKK